MAEMNIEDINDLIKKDYKALVEESERSYRKLISELADEIKSRESVRIALIAGPSGSGKTTSANLLADALVERGEECIVVSLDDFYRNPDDAQYPRTADGELDFESVYALDLPLLTDTLLNISESKPFSVPKYDFKKGARTDISEHSPMPHGCVIIEGLHALNPELFSKLSPDSLIKIFISVSTNINKEGRRILSGRKIRFLRRMIRDSIYRNADAERTLGMWRGVLLGEDKYLYPNRKYADISFNTFHPFELSVMRPYAEALISDDLAEREPYAKTVLWAARCARAIPIDAVPDSSLIREFIPGGKYESVY